MNSVRKLDKHGYDLEQGGDKRQKMAGALQGCSHFTVGLLLEETRACTRWLSFKIVTG